MSQPHICIHWKGIATVSLVICHLTQSQFVFLVKRTFKILSLSTVQIYNTVWSFSFRLYYPALI